MMLLRWTIAALVLLMLLSAGCLVDPDPTLYTLTMETIGGGNTDPPADTHQIKEGTTVYLSAEDVAEQWVFDHWRGNVADTEARETTIVMDQDQAVESVFTYQEGAYFHVTVEVSPTEGTWDDSIEVAITVENIGVEPDTQWIDFSVDYEEGDPPEGLLPPFEMHLAPGESEQEVIDQSIPEHLDPGTYILTAESSDHADSASFRLHGETVLNPVKETFIATRPDTEIAEALWSEYWADPEEPTAHSYLLFDLDSLPSGVEIISAKLFLYAETVEVIDGDIGAFQVLEPWSGQTSWEDRPDAAEDPVDAWSIAVAPGETQWLQWDVLPVVNRWLEGTAENHGFKIGYVSADDFFGAAFTGTGSEAVEYHPKLVLQYATGD